jgi:hypothetical protein
MGRYDGQRIGVARCPQAVTIEVDAIRGGDVAQAHVQSDAGDRKRHERTGVGRQHDGTTFAAPLQRRERDDECGRPRTGDADLLDAQELREGDGQIRLGGAPDEIPPRER